MDALHILHEHRPFVLVSFTKIKACEAASGIPLYAATLESFLIVIKNEIFFYKDVQNRRVLQLNNVPYNHFRRHEDKEKIATCKCINHLVDHQKDLPLYLQALNHLLTRLRDVLRHLPWCSTLYHRTELHEDATSLAQKLISAAANTNFSTLSSSQNTHLAENFMPMISTSRSAPFSHLVALFANTPPPPRYHRPIRYLHTHGISNSYRSDFRSSHDRPY